MKNPNAKHYLKRKLTIYIYIYKGIKLLFMVGKFSTLVNNKGFVDANHVKYYYDESFSWANYWHIKMVTQIK